MDSQSICLLKQCPANVCVPQSEPSSWEARGPPEAAVRVGVHTVSDAHHSDEVIEGSILMEQKKQSSLGNWNTPTFSTGSEH